MGSEHVEGENSCHQNTQCFLVSSNEFPKRSFLGQGSFSPSSRVRRWNGGKNLAIPTFWDGDATAKVVTAAVRAQ